MTKKDILEIYLTMQGDVIGSPWAGDIENLYLPGSECDELYDRAYNLRIKLGDRLHCVDDEDVESLFNILLDIAQLHSFEMFRCGYRLGEKLRQSTCLTDIY